MKNRNTAFGLPTGTVRAIITILLIIVTAIVGGGIINMVANNTMSDELLKTAVGIFTAFNTLSSLMIGSYITKK